MSDNDGPRIIIDEDWKAKVEREREEERKRTGEAPAAADEPEAEQPSLESLVSSLALQAAVALGLIAPRDAKEIRVDLRQAKYFIDMLMIIREKTRGNLTPEEQGYLTETLADLQQTFVYRSQQVQESALRKAGIDLGPNPGARRA